MYGKFFIVLTVNGPSLLLGDTKPHAPLGPLCLDPGLYTLSGMLVRGGQTNYILGDLYFIQLLQLPLFSAQLKLSTTWSKGRGNQLILRRRENTQTQALQQMESRMNPGWGVSALGGGKPLLPPASLQPSSNPPNTLVIQPTHNTPTRAWAGTVACAKGQTHSSQIAWRQTPSRSWSLASLFALQRFLKRGGVCKLSPAVPVSQLSSSRETGS